MKHLIAAVALTTFAMPALGADLGMAEPVYVPESVSSSAFDWSGFYAGINGGYGWAEIETVTTTFSDFEGLLGGAQVGYNHSFGQFVLGVEGDIQFSDIDFQQDLTAPFSEDVSLDAFGTIRARAGVAVDRFLPYVTAGIAWGHVTAELSAPGFSEEVDAEFVGFTAGGGLEYAVTDNVSVKGEYLYTDFGSGNFGAGGSDVNLTSHMARVGFNYRF